MDEEVLQKAALRALVVKQQLERLGRGIGAAYRLRLANSLPGGGDAAGLGGESEGRFATAFSSSAEFSANGRPAQNSLSSSISICTPGRT